MLLRWALGLIAAAGLVLSPTVGQAQGKRHALLIGINEYREINRLEKAVGDAEALAETLKGFGYETTIARNPTRRELNEALSRFLGGIGPDDTAVVHFSGHGVEINQQNFLLPADMPAIRADLGNGASDFVRGEALALSDLMQRVNETPAAVRIFILDACRDNPFAASGTRSVGGRRGLNVREATPAGAFVLYSAGIGQQALDRLGPADRETTSVYTRVLLRHLKRDSSIATVAQDVRREVRDLARRIGHVQSPAYYDEFIGSNEFYVDPLRDPKRGWLAACQNAPPPATAETWLHNGQQMAMMTDGAKRRIHYIEPRKSIADRGATPGCMLIDGEVTGGMFKGLAHIYRAQCGMYPYTVEGSFTDGSTRVELRGPSPIPADNCRIIRLEPTSPNATLIFERAPVPGAPQPNAPSEAGRGVTAEQPTISATPRP